MLLVMENVMMISRHRQWRAWQFGRRHSGLFSGRGGTSSGGDNDPDEERRANKALNILVIIFVIVGIISLISPQIGGYILGTMIWLAIIGWIIKIFCL